MNNPQLELVGVTKRYIADGPCVLDDVSLAVQAGESLAIVGPSGCGKSTLLNIAGALDRPSAGKVLLDGNDLATLNDEQLAGVRNRRVGFVFQMHHLLPQCTVIENVLVPTLAGGQRASCDERISRAMELLKRVGMADRADYLPGQLSGGQLQRAAVVRALINKPDILLADEPTGSLDHVSAVGLADLLVDLNSQLGLTLIVVTHSMELAGRMGRLYELRDGRIAESKGKA